MAKDAMQIASLFFSLLLVSNIWRITANVRLPAFILEDDFRLIERRAKQIIGEQFYTRTRRRADAQPFQP